MSWDAFEISEALIGEAIKSGEGYYARERQFITLPENTVYEAGYGFYMSARLVGDGRIRLPDDYHVELQMEPSARAPGRRYKRYKLTGRDIKESVLLPYRHRLAEEERAREITREKRNERIKGNIVYGQYEGNRYGDQGDLFKDYFFFNGKRYYNCRYDKVANVRVDFIVMEDVSKRFYDEMVDEIEKRLRPYFCVRDCIDGLRAIVDPDERTLHLISLLERENEQALKDLQVFLAEKRRNQKMNRR